MRVYLTASSKFLVVNTGQLMRVMYSKTCLKRSLKKVKIKVLKTDDSLMQVKSIAECSVSILLYF